MYTSPQIHICIAPFWTQQVNLKLTHRKIFLPSKHSYPCKHPPTIFDDPMDRAYTLCVIWLIHVSAYPRFLSRKLQAPMAAYSRDYGTCLVGSHLWSEEGEKQKVR